MSKRGKDLSDEDIKMQIPKGYKLQRVFKRKWDAKRCAERLHYYGGFNSKVMKLNNGNYGACIEIEEGV